jgi:serine/threonine protein kinase
MCSVSDDRDKHFFEHEVHILATLGHPALLSLQGYTPFVRNPEHLPSIFTPLMPRGSLDDILKLDRLGQATPEWTWTRKMMILLGVALGMMCMHERRVIHRDLKSANILLDENFDRKIGDFGLSKFVEPGRSLYQTMSVGTAQFMAPEIRQGRILVSRLTSMLMGF